MNKDKIRSHSLAFHIYRLSENLVEDESKLLQRQNVSYESIYNAAAPGFPNAASICKGYILFKMLKAMFPCIKKSKIVTNGTFKASIIGIKFENLPLQENVSFCDIKKYIPSQWYIAEESNITLKLFSLSAEKFNGKSVQTELVIHVDGCVDLVIAGKPVDLSKFLISKKLKFTKNSVCGLFKCLKTMFICHGATLETNQSDSFSSSNKCVKEIYTLNSTSKTIVRHIQCSRVVSVTSLSSVCSKCSDYKHYKIRQQASIAFDSEKENRNPNDNIDITNELRKIAPHLNDNQILLMSAQIKSSECKNPKGMRWPKEIISMTLTLYNRNPSAYKDLVKNEWLKLPSESLLHLYKSAIKQKPGIIPEMMSWMQQEATRLLIPKEGYYGGILLDEMSLQEDIQIVRDGKDSYLSGVVENEPDVMLMHVINEGKYESKLANHVLQYMFHGLTGFRWPFANYPTTQAAPADIFLSTWKCVDSLYEWGFKPIYCCMDGSSNNRAFLKMHFPENDTLSTRMVASNFKNPSRKMIFIMDPCHLIKKNTQQCIDKWD